MSATNPGAWPDPWGKEIGFEQFLTEAQANQLQPYWAAWLYATGRPLDYQPESNAEYMAWISAKHAEFRPMTQYLNSGRYHYEFLEFLKKKVAK